MSFVTTRPDSIGETAFSMHGELYKAIARQAHVIHESFVQTLQTSKTSYWLTELANRAGTST